MSQIVKGPECWASKFGFYSSSDMELIECVREKKRVLLYSLTTWNALLFLLTNSNPSFKTQIKCPLLCETV